VASVPLGFPLGLLAALLHEWRQSSKKWIQLNLEDSGADSLVEYNSRCLHATFGFCMGDYRGECFWFEPVDMLRKLALSGLLQFVHRGTAAQCFCGSATAFLSFGVQQWLRPYREHESNVLKAMVDTQLFLTFLISFILRVLPEINSGEPVGALFYGRLLLCSLGMLLLVAIGLTIAQVCRRRRFKERLLTSGVELGSLTRSSGMSLLEGASLDDGPANLAAVSKDHDNGDTTLFDGAFTIGHTQEND